MATKLKGFKEIMRLSLEFKRFRVPVPPALDQYYDIEAMMRMNEIAFTDPEFVPLTPLGRNAQEMAYGKDKPLRMEDPIAQGEIDVILACKQIAEKYGYLNEEKRSKSTLFESYAESVRRNLLKMGREVTPGAAQRRYENIKEYFNAKHIWKIENPSIYETAINLVIAANSFHGTIPHTDSFPKGKAPFTNYNTNTGGPRFHNDRTKLKGVSYDEIAVRDARKLDPTDLPGLPFTIGGRDQRSGVDLKVIKQLTEANLLKYGFKDSKARVILPSSRPGNIGVAKVSYNVIDYLRDHKTPFYCFNAPIIGVPEFKKSQKFFSDLGYDYENIDYSTFDITVSLQDRIAAYLIRDAALKTQLAKKINLYSTLMGAKAPIGYFDPNRKEKDDITKRYFQGTIRSGELDTGVMGGLVNAKTTAYLMMCEDPEGSRIVSKAINRGIIPGGNIGDDGCGPIKRSNKDKILENIGIRALRELGKVINKSKVEANLFLQKVMTPELSGHRYLTPFPRIVSKMFGLERDKPLGEYAGTIANGMKLYEIRYNPEGDDVIKLLFKYDKTKLGLYTLDGSLQSVKQFQAGLVAESRQQQLSTRARVYDGNPSTSGLFTKDGNAAGEFVTYMFSRLRKVLETTSTNDHTS